MSEPGCPADAGCGARVIRASRPLPAEPSANATGALPIACEKEPVEPACSTSTWAVSTPVVPSRSTSGRTAAMRTPLQDSMPIDFQMPLVATSTPQSHPKFDAFLRSAL